MTVSKSGHPLLARRTRVRLDAAAREVLGACGAAWTSRHTARPCLDCTYGLAQVSANVGQTLELTATVPVSWSVEESLSNGSPCMSGATSASTTWSGKVSVRGTAIYPSMVGGFLVHAVPSSGNPARYNIAAGGLMTASSPPACD